MAFLTSFHITVYIIFSHIICVVYAAEHDMLLTNHDSRNNRHLAVKAELILVVDTAIFLSSVLNYTCFFN